MMQQKITEIIIGAQRRRKPCLSFEFFPPKTDEGFEKFQGVASQLSSTNPSFVTVTYGAGGSTRMRTLEMCQWLQENLDITVMPHLTCVESSQQDLKGIIQEIYNAGFRNIMALRGDPSAGQKNFCPPPDGFAYANELIDFIKKDWPDFCVGCGGYPETHPEAPSFEVDLTNLKRKVDAGADFITTQLFFDNTHFYRFVEAAQKNSITVPIIPGIMPVLSYSQIKRFTDMCGAALPANLIQQLDLVSDDPEATEQIGIRWAATQIEDLLKHNTPAIHLYILNRSRAALELAKRLTF
jgi:methylenetetrahydrofolate reductase (NADPH)